MAEFKERFGLDYLKGKEAVQPKTEVSGLPPGMEQAVLAYSRLVLDALKNSPGKTGQLIDLAREVNVRLDVLIRVVEYLDGRGYLRREPEDLGNDTFRLTIEGEKLLG